MSGCGVVLAVLAAAVFTCGVFGLVYYFTAPAGEAVGTMPADGRSATRVTLAEGDSLAFTLAYEFPVLQFGFADSPSRDHAIDDALRASSFVVTATPDAGGPPLEARCAPYNGRTGSVSEVLGKRSMSGVLTDCVVPITHAGTYTVVGAITWASVLQASGASIEVRRVRPERP